MFDSMESYYFGTYDETQSEVAVYNIYRDYHIDIEYGIEESRVPIPRVLYDRSPDSWEDISHVPQTFLEDKVLSVEDMELLPTNAKEAVVSKLILSQTELLGDNLANLPSYTSSEEIIKRLSLIHI